MRKGNKINPKVGKRGKYKEELKKLPVRSIRPREKADPKGPAETTSQNLSISFGRFSKEVLGKVDPGSDKKRIKLVEQIHNQCHEATDGLFRRLWYSGYYWKGMRKLCTTMARNCELCLVFNIAREGYHPLKPIEALCPNDHWAYDHGTISRPKGEEYFLVVVDIASRYIWLRAAEDRTAETTGKILYHIVCEFGIPKVMQSDNAPEYRSKALATLKELCRYDHRFVSTYHARANGAAEAHVKLVKKLLPKLVMGDWNVWKEFLPPIQMTLNERIWTKNQTRPFELMFARSVQTLGQQLKTTPRKNVTAILQHHRRVNELVHPTLAKRVHEANKKVAEVFDRKHKTKHTEQRFAPGTCVYVKIEPKPGKMKPKYTGPYSIVTRNRGKAYVLQNHCGDVEPGSFPPSKLKTADAVVRDLPPIISLLGHRGGVKNREYRVLMEGTNERFWLPAQSLCHCLDLIEDYWERVGSGEDACQPLSQDTDVSADYVPEGLDESSVSTQGPIIENTSMPEHEQGRGTDHVWQTSGRRSRRRQRPARYRDGCNPNDVIGDDELQYTLHHLEQSE